MDNGYEDYYEEPEPFKARPRDPKTDEAKAALVELFGRYPERVFYLQQLKVLLEDGSLAQELGVALGKGLFHWITARGLKELAAEGKINDTVTSLMARVSPGRVLPGLPAIRFFWHRPNRYWRRKAEAIRKLVVEFSQSEFGHALGYHGEQMFDAALPRVGFLPAGRNVREYAGKAWTETGHNFDRVFCRDGIAYGTEVKNTLDYIDRDELQVKLRMCEALGLKPLFIVRMAPKSYVEEVRRTGGFTLIFKFQLYPFGHDELARRVKEQLGLPVACPVAIADGTVERFLNWHLETHGLAGGGVNL